MIRSVYHQLDSVHSTRHEYNKRNVLLDDINSKLSKIGQELEQIKMEMNNEKKGINKKE